MPGPLAGADDRGQAGAPGTAVPDAGGPLPPWGEYGAPGGAAPVLPAAGPAGAPGSADPLRGVLAGLVAAVLGAAAWALLVLLTHYEIGFVAIFLGYGVGWAVHRFGGVASTGLAVASAALAAMGILLGFVLAQIFVGAHDAGIGVMDAVDTVTSDIGWGTFITHSVTGLGWLFLALGAYSAFRIVAQSARR